jgi:hypothetical protein
MRGLSIRSSKAPPYPWMMEGETQPLRLRRHNAAALEDQLGLGPQQDGPEREQPSRLSDRDPRLQSHAQLTHQVAVGDRVRSCEVDHALGAGLIDQPLEEAGDVLFMHPAHVLSAGAVVAAEARCHRAGATAVAHHRGG